MVDFATVQTIRDVELGTSYTNVTLVVKGSSGTFTDMSGIFAVEQLSTGNGTFCRAPTFRRTFPDGNVVTYGLHTPSRRMDLLIGTTCHSPQELVKVNV